MYWIGLGKITPNCAGFQQEKAENMMLYLWLSAFIRVQNNIFSGFA
jgi:hypothetical protein